MFPKRTDANQKEIVAGLRKMGYSVFVTSNLGHGFPDLVAGRYGVNYLLEVKDGAKPPSCRMLTDQEEKFIQLWKGKVLVITSIEDFIAQL